MLFFFFQSDTYTVLAANNSALPCLYPLLVLSPWKQTFDYFSCFSVLLCICMKRAHVFLHLPVLEIYLHLQPQERRALVPLHPTLLPLSLPLGCVTAPRVGSVVILSLCQNQVSKSIELLSQIPSSESERHHMIHIYVVSGSRCK